MGIVLACRLQIMGGEVEDPPAPMNLSPHRAMEYAMEGERDYKYEVGMLCAEFRATLGDFVPLEGKVNAPFSVPKK